MSDAVRCSNIIRQINDHANEGGLLTSNIGLENGVTPRSCCFCLDRLWAWMKGVSFDKDEVAKSINTAFQSVNISYLNVSKAELTLFSKNLVQLSSKFSNGSQFNQNLIGVITAVSTHALQKKPTRQTIPFSKVSPQKTMVRTGHMGVASAACPNLRTPTRHSTFSSVRTPLLSQKPKPSSYMITGNSRPGKTHIPIRIPIANVSDLQLTEKNLPEIFRRANKVTVNTQYAVQNTSRFVAGKMVHRPNHNGTHSARQARHLEALFSLVEHRGSTEAQGQLRNLSQSEKLNLSLAAYFLRAGRVDESSHKNPPADDYYTRSAMIYEQYAKQMGENPTTIAWTKKLMINSCKPRGVRDADIDTNSKNRFGYEVLTMVHELDLIRCFGRSQTASTVQSMRSRLDYFVSSSRSGSKDQHMNQFMRYAKDLCKATGCSRTYDGHPGNAALFAKSSVQGDFCWNQVRAQRFPRWA